MVHINIKQSSCTDTTFLVETSTDGAGWKVQADFRAAYPLEPAGAILERAEEYARSFAAGARYAGADVRGTSCGQDISLYISSGRRTLEADFAY